ncbi:MAG: AI-2E family transporter, partial [Oscillospiraceae bacterium]|nr:AI-2E family transporter [Oscillospiraceae bacterium]
QTKSILRIIFISILFYFFLKEISFVMSGLAYIWSVLSVFAIGGAMAFIVNVPMKYIENNFLPDNKKLGKAKRPMAFIITLALVVFIIYLVLFIVVPQLIATLQTLIAQMQAVYEKLPQIIADITAKFNLTEETVQSLQIEWSHISEGAIAAIQSIATGIINSSTSLIGGVVNAITQFVLAFIFCIYILFSKEKLGRACKRLFYALFKENRADNIINVLHMANRTLTKFL